MASQKAIDRYIASSRAEDALAAQFVPIIDAVCNQVAEVEDDVTKIEKMREYLTHELVENGVRINVEILSEHATDEQLNTISDFNEKYTWVKTLMMEIGRMASERAEKESARIFQKALQHAGLE